MVDEKPKTLWDYFTNLKDEKDAKTAICNLCSRTLKYTSTTANLKSHLQRIHNIEIGNLNQIKRPQGNAVWRHFTTTGLASKLACCNYCKQMFSFKSTSANLKWHLRRCNEKVYFSEFPEEHEIADVNAKQPEYIFAEYLEDSDETDEELSSSPYWNYFERDGGGGALCVVCRGGVPFALPALRQHMADNHRKIYDDLTQDSEINHSEEVYTEVIYVDSKPEKEDIPVHKSKSLPKKSYTPCKNSGEGSPVRKKSYRHSESNESLNTDKRKSCNFTVSQEDEELATFSSYVTCLLKTVSKELSMRLQRDIINMIMNAKFEEKSMSATSSTNEIRIIVDNKYVEDQSTLNSSHTQVEPLNIVEEQDVSS